jgi:hypothetical protein
MKILPLGDKNDPSGVAIFYEVEDDTLKTIKRTPDYYMDREFVQRCFAEKGRNAHLYLLVNDRDLKEIQDKLAGLLKKYKTVSWWGVGHEKFYLRRGVCA